MVKAEAGDTREPGSIPVGEDPLEYEWQPNPVFLPGKFQGQRSLAGYSLWDHKELDMTEHAHTHTFLASFF